MLLKSAINHYSIAASTHVNHAVAVHLPYLCPFIMVAEFPRSGGNWIRDMLGDCLQLPVPRFSKLPITFNALAHSHLPTPIKKTKAVYILRDGRDVFVSHYWKSVNGVLSDNLTLKSTILSKHPSLKKLISDNNANHKELMQAFYQEWRVRPMGCPLNWGAHVSTWLAPQPSSLTVIRYEDMHVNPHETLCQAVQSLNGNKVKDEVLSFAVHRNSFKEKTGRLSGEGDNKSNRRRGIVGDWKNSFTDDLSRSFSKDFSDALAIGGYD